LTDPSLSRPIKPNWKKNPWILIPLIIVILLVPPILSLRVMSMAGPLTENKTVVIPHGTSIHGIATLLDNNNVVLSPFVFRIAARLIAGDQLQAGEYEFPAKESIADIVVMMHEGHSVVHLFTVAEGLTSAEIKELLRNSPALTGDILVPPEGSLLPETYRYSYGDSRAALVTRMQKSMQEALSELWTKRDMSIPLKSPEEAVIMASMIEKETGKPVERPRIAGVFYNRLRQNMRLQSDPTVIYAIVHAKGSLDRDLTHDDLAFVSPYNTYTSDGLPPTPICNPGKAAIDAALHPEQNDFLYFVADGTGGHSFAKNLAAHNQNVTKWTQIKPKP